VLRGVRDEANSSDAFYVSANNHTGNIVDSVRMLLRAQGSSAD